MSRYFAIFLLTWTSVCLAHGSHRSAFQHNHNLKNYDTDHGRLGHVDDEHDPATIQRFYDKIGHAHYVPGTIPGTIHNDAAHEGIEIKNGWYVRHTHREFVILEDTRVQHNHVLHGNEEDQPETLTPRLSISAATAGEDAGTLIFAVSLSVSVGGDSATVSWTTSDATATAGADYVAASGTLAFAPGEREKTVVVTLLDDALSEGDETFTVTLSSPQNAVLGTATATGTITDDESRRRREPGIVVDDDDGPAGPGARIRKEWLAQFVRSLTTELVGMLSGRLRDGGQASRFTLGGHRVGVGGDPDLRTGGSGWLRGEVAGADMERRSEPTTMTRRELLLGSSFHMATDRVPGGYGRLSSWGRTSPTWFGSTGGAAGDGMTGLLGADYRHGSVLTGVALSYSEGSGSRGGFSFAGEIAGAHPYLRYGLSEDVSLWSLLGHGSGELRWSERADDERSLRSEIDYSLAALGGRVSLTTVQGFDIALKGDVFAARIGSGSGRRLPGAAGASRVRLLVEGSGVLNRLATSVRAGLRQDGGDDMTGTGMELETRLGYADSVSGVSASGHLHGFLREGDHGEWRAEGALSYAPGAAGRGLALDASLSWGAATDAVDDLWSRGESTEPVSAPAAGRATVALGYGLVARGTDVLATPFMETHWWDRGELRLRGGVRLAGSGGAGGYGAELAAERVEGGKRAGGPEHRIGLTLRLPLGR